MKKLVAILSVALLVASNSFAYKNPNYESYQEKRNGTSKMGVPVRTLKLVRNSAASPNSATIAEGSAVIYDLTSDDGVSVTDVSTSDDAAFAGIVASGCNIPTSDATTGTTASDDAARRNWGWIVVHGPASARAGAGGTNNHAAGDVFITSSDDGKVATYSAINPLGSKKSASSVGGFFMDAADGTSTSFDVFVRAE